jgi:DNA sulfur modification protein DndC
MLTDIPQIQDEMRKLYLSDDRPWIVGYSGGKDSTAVVQMVYYMLAGLSKRQKPYKTVHVVCNDTLVESPPVQSHMTNTIQQISKAAKAAGLPIVTKITQPELKNRFFVKVIGRGYPAPTRVFRWCTDKLKIQPTNSYIKKQITDAGEVIIVLGTRRSESNLRARSIKKHEETNGNGLLRDHVNLKNAFIYSPIQELELNDIWVYLLQVPSPWGSNHRDLWNLYGKAGGRDCPLVIDPTTVPCGTSRFGCWTCTVVRNDKSMEGLIDHGEDWLLPLLEFRDWLKIIREDHSLREPTRRSGKDGAGPFTLKTRQVILERLNQVENETKMELLPAEERVEINRLWRMDGFVESSEQHLKTLASHAD